MSLRDYFAAQVMVHAMKHWQEADAADTDDGKGTFNWEGADDIEDGYWNQPEIYDHCLVAAQMAYHMADAMLKARK